MREIRTTVGIKVMWETEQFLSGGRIACETFVVVLKNEHKPKSALPLSQAPDLKGFLFTTQLWLFSAETRI